MATSSVSVTVLALGLWLVAATFPTSTWAIRDLAEFKDERMIEFNTQPTVIHVDPATNCLPSEISIAQHIAPDHPGPSRFNVQIINTSSSPIWNIVVNCGAFASAIPFDPNVFRRVGDGPTCIVNNGNAMTSGQTLSFFYEQKSIQPLSLASAECVP